ncbi:Lactose regulatory protein LAC9 like [Verticillium longisporum]|nr:Lactose regulatory protein LAC9 like [Verticillium longisporum]
MFHTFGGTDPTASHLSPQVARPISRRVNKSCSECTRRKVKCDGRVPCASCQYYKTSESCVYRQRTKRQAVIKSTLEQVTEQMQVQQRILNTLFPHNSPEDLVGRSRTELLQLLSTASPSDTSVCDISPEPLGPSPQYFLSGTGGTDVSDGSTQASEAGDTVQERRWDESAQQPAEIGASDDINAISLATDQHRRSYLGVTSMSAVIGALFRLCPAAKARTIEFSKELSKEQNPSHQQASDLISGPNLPALNQLREQRCVEFYFEHIHAITPILNEEEFRRTYIGGTRQDASWLGLLNMVLTLGSIASGSNTLHVQYYKQARVFLDLDSLGSGNMESLQALCLLGGYYLHYRNSPNMAYAVLGAAQRVAIALGLHRDSSRRTHDQGADTNQENLLRIETRRRTWWSLFCLDTWASMTLGRPTCGRWDNTTMDTLPPSLLSPDDHCAISLRSSCQFCHICNRIQHRFAQLRRMSAIEALTFDQELRDWYETLPSVVKYSANSPPRVTTAREFLRNRYLNVRLVLSRPFLLYLAHDSAKQRIFAPEEEQMIDTCRSIAAEAIDAITLHWTPNHIHVWNSAWYLFQACMVPLLSIAMETAWRPGIFPERVDRWSASLTKALDIFNDMKPWMRESDRAAHMVATLFQAVTVTVENQVHPSTSPEGAWELPGWCDEQLADIDWNMFLSEENAFNVRSRGAVLDSVSQQLTYGQNVRGGKSAATRLSLADDAHEDELQFLASLKQGLQDASDLELLGQQVQRRIDNLESGLPMTPAGSIIGTTQYDAAPSPGEAIASGSPSLGTPPSVTNLSKRTRDSSSSENAEPTTTSLWSLVNSPRQRQELGLTFDDSLIELQFRKLTEILYEEDFLQHPSMFSVQAITLVTRLGHNLGLSQVTGNLLGAAHGIARAGSVRLARSDWLEQIEIEVGKRTWWQLVIQDYFSIPFTETYAIHPAQFTTPIPRNCNDDDLIEKDNTAMTSSAYTRIIAQQALLVAPALDGLGPLGSRKHSKEIYEHISRCDADMRRNIHSLPTCLLREDHRDSQGPVISLPWLPTARRTMAISAADKIINIHRPLLFYSFQSSHFPRTRATCTAAAVTILREHERAASEDTVAIWTQTAFCITAVIVLGLELLHQSSHSSEAAIEYRQLLSKAGERLRKRACDVLAAKCATLIEVLLSVEEELVIKVMRMRDGTIEEKQREAIDELIASQDILAKFLDLDPVFGMRPMFWESPAASEAWDPAVLYDVEQFEDFDVWYNEVFSGVAY